MFRIKADFQKKTIIKYVKTANVSCELLFLSNNSARRFWESGGQCQTTLFEKGFTPLPQHNAVSKPSAEKYHVAPSLLLVTHKQETPYYPQNENVFTSEIFNVHRSI